MSKTTRAIEATLMNARMEGQCFVAYVAWGQVGFDVKAPPHAFHGKMKQGDRIIVEYDANGHLLTGPYLSIRPAH